MAWLKGKKARPTEEIQVLRAGLTQLLQTLATGTAPRHAAEIQALVARLTKGSTPTGLDRELTRLFGQPSKPSDAGEIFAETARALGSAMAQVSMSDDLLDQSIQQLQASVPDEVKSMDARQLTKRARTLEELAGPIRQRVLSAQGETALILEAVNHAFAGTQTASGRISKNAGKLARTFAEAHDDVALRAMRGQITQALQGLAQDAGQLMERMSTTKARTQELEDRMEKQAAILGVLDSCRRIRKELERYGDNDTKIIKSPKGMWDALTGVYSLETYERLLARATRAADETGRPLSLVLVEIADLNKLTEMYGDAARDTVIKTLGRQLTEVVNDNDVLSRIAPGQFALLLPDTSLEKAMSRSAKAKGVLKRVAFASRAGRFHAILNCSTAVQRPGESPKAFETRAGRGLDSAR